MRRPLIDQRQRHTLKERAEWDRKREKAARAQKARAHAERVKRLREAEKRSLQTSRTKRKASNLDTFRDPVSFQQARKQARGTYQNKMDVHEVEDKGAWPLKCDPAWYLKRYPDGEYAELARRMTGQ